MNTNTQVERLDYSKRPPDYRVAWRTHGAREWVVAFPLAQVRLGLAFADDLNQYATETAALAAAWSHHKERHDPPGLRVVGTGDQDQAFKANRYFFLSSTDAEENAARRAEARAAAWAWHDERLALRDRLDALAREARECGHLFVHEDTLPWPAPLALSAADLAAVNAYLDSKGALQTPEVLRG